VLHAIESLNAEEKSGVALMQSLELLPPEMDTVSNLPDCKDVIRIIISEEYLCRRILNDLTTGSYLNRINTGNIFVGG